MIFIYNYLSYITSLLVFSQQKETKDFDTTDMYGSYDIVKASKRGYVHAQDNVIKKGGRHDKNGIINKIIIISLFISNSIKLK